MKNRWPLALFGLVFGLAFGAGAWFGGWATLVQVANGWHQTRDWTPIQAKVLHAELHRHRGENADTYSVSARYSYNYGMREYQSERVGLVGGRADNFDDWHERWYNKLRTARDRGQTVEAWMDPAHPERAILDRQVRWKAVNFAALFALAFSAGSAVGWFLLWWSFKMPATPDAPGLNEKRIQRSLAGGATGQIIIGIIALCMGLGFSYMIYSKFPAPHLTWLFFLFPLLCLTMVWEGVKGLGDAKKLGAISLQLADQHPSLGERMRGTIEFERSPGSQPYEVRLFCEQVDTRGKDTSTTFVWEKDLRVRPIGNRLPFSFELPRDIPPSEPMAPVYHRWVLQLHSDELGHPLDFEVNIFASDAGSSAAAALPEALRAEVRHALSEPVAAGEQEDAKEDSDRERIDPIPPEVATVVTGLNRLRIDYSTALHRPAAWASGFFGLAFGGMGIGAGYGGAPIGFPVIFCTVGIALLYVALRCVWVRRCVQIVAGKLSVEEANIFGRKQQSFPVSEIVDLIPTIGYSASRGSKRTTYYRLNAVTRSNEAALVGAGISSQHVAESLLRLLRRYVGKQANLGDIEYARKNSEKLGLRQGERPQPWAVRHIRKIVPVVFVGIFALMAGPMLLDFYKAFQDDGNSPARKKDSKSASWSDSTASASRIAATPEAWFAAMNADRLDDLKAIAALGFDIDTQAADNGSSALAFAATKGHLAIAEWLIDAGADIHQRNGYKSGNNYLTTPLMRAGFGANPKLIALLLDKGADVHAEDHFKRTPLHFAAWGGCGECIRMLAHRGAGLEARAAGNRGETPLMTAAGNGKVDGVRTLLALGADAQAKDSYGYTPLGWAQFYKQSATAALLEGK